MLDCTEEVIVFVQLICNYVFIPETYHH